MDSDITQLLHAWTGGDRKSLDELTPLVYGQLHQMAERIFSGERANHTLQPTALVNEAFAQMVRVDVDWQDRSHFFALSGRLMRRILVDHARTRHAAKRGGHAVQLPIDDLPLAAEQTGEEVLQLDEAMHELAASDERKAEILELHYFGGLTLDEIAEVTGLSTSTINRELRFAKAWLKVRLTEAN